MLIGELARKAHVHPETVRRLERNGVLIPVRDRNGWRIYGADAVKILQDYYKRQEGETRHE